MEKKEESAVKEDDDMDEDSDALKKLEEAEEIQVRDIRYNLEKLGY